MDLLVDDKSYVIFDLDDTLYPERAFVESGFRHIDDLLTQQLGRSVVAEMMDRFDRREDVFEWILSQLPMPAAIGKDRLLQEYRSHLPRIGLGEGAKELLDHLRSLGVEIGLMTDGRSLTQRNKIKALGLQAYLTDILISEEFGSEKPDPRNYRFFAEKYPDRSFVFIGDNTRKDFIVPAQLGWTTICLKCSGKNIHRQDFSLRPGPDHIISSLRDVRLITTSASIGC
jgi:putative hydrolase of the HAD superfamily